MYNNSKQTRNSNKQFRACVKKEESNHRRRSERKKHESLMKLKFFHLQFCKFRFPDIEQFFYTSVFS